MPDFKIEKNIASAKTLQSDFYLDDRVFEASKASVFSRTWQFAGLRPSKKTAVPFFLLEGFLDEPLVLLDGATTRCFSNVCTHRGNILVKECTAAETIRCGYHGRRFDSDGRFLSMPEFEGVLDFPTGDDDLPEVELASFSELMFVSLDPINGFDSFLGPVNHLFGDFGSGITPKLSTAEYEVNAHWALYCENFLEGFHIPFIHPGLNKELDFGSYETTVDGYTVLQTGFGQSGTEADAKGLFSNGVAAYYYFVFPNLMFNFYPWGLSFNVVEPVTKELTRIKYVSLVLDEKKRLRGAGSGLEQVEAEDHAVVESVQKGIRSRFYNRGRYSVNREQGVHHFHRLLAEFMNSGEV